MPAAPASQYRYAQRPQLLLEQPVQRHAINPGEIPHQNTTQPIQLTCQTQVRKQAIDPVQRLVDVFDKQNDAFIVQLKR